MRDNKDLAERAAKERVTELFRSAGGGAPPEKIDHDIAAFSRRLEVSFAKHSDWQSPEFVDSFIAASGALIRARLAEISNSGSGSA
jgi:hypothetical protein